MMSNLFLLVLVVCGLVQAQQGDEKKVAFSAALVEDSVEWVRQEAGEADKTLLFQKVVTNVGNGYNKETGIFTVPVKGLYYVQLTGMVGNTGEMNAGVKKNREMMFAIHQKAGTKASASNGMVLALEQNDQLFAQLWAGQSIADQGRLTTFTIFLVSPM